MKTKKKGCPHQAAKNIKTKDVLRMVKQPTIQKCNYSTLSSKAHSIRMVHYEKSVTNSFDNGAFYKNCGLCNIPFHCTIPNIEHCDSLRCKRNRIMVNIWFRLVNEV